MKTENIITNFLYNLLVFVTCLLCVTSNNQEYIKSLTYSFYVLVTILAIFLFNQKKIDSKNIKKLFLFLIEIAFLIVSLLITNGGFGSIIFIFIMSLVLFEGTSCSINSKSIVFTFIISSFSFFYMITHNYYNLNSNDAAGSVFRIFILMVSSFSILFEQRKIKKTKLIKLLVFLLTSFLLIICVYRYDSRNVLFSSIMLIVLYFFPIEKCKKSKVWYKVIPFFISFGSLIFISFYLFMYNNNYMIDLSFLSNKAFFSGREYIWNYLYNLFIDGRYIFGIGSHLVLVNNMGAHNYMFSVLVIFGIPHFIVFYLLLKEYFSDIINNLSYKNRIVLLSIISFFITAFFETTFISTANLSVLFMLSILGCYTIEDNDKISLLTK